MERPARKSDGTFQQVKMTITFGEIISVQGFMRGPLKDPVLSFSLCDQQDDYIGYTEKATTK